MNEINVSMDVLPGSISLNYEETKAYIVSILEEYQGAIFSDESIKLAKTIVAELRKQQKELDSRRVSAKKEYLKPFEAAEEKAKELIGLYNQPINFIDSQIKGFEERKKAEKKERVQDLYENLIGDLKEFLPFSKIYNLKWENQTFTMKNIQEELEEVISSTDKAIKVISGMKSEVVPQALEKFKLDLSVTNAMAFINDYESQKAAILEREKAKRVEEAEREKQAEIERIRREERERVLAEQKAEEEKRVSIEQAKREAEEKLLSVKEVKTPIDDELGADDIEKTVFTVFATAEEIEQIEMYMNSIGVEYRRE